MNMPIISQTNISQEGLPAALVGLDGVSEVGEGGVDRGDGGVVRRTVALSGIPPMNGKGRLLPEACKSAFD